MVFASVVALAGCTAVQFTYNNAPSLVRYMAWDYVEPDSQQSEALQQRVAMLHDWHRASELPGYVALVEDASGRFSRGVVREDVNWAIGTLRRTYRRMAARAAQEAAPILVTLRPEQMESLQKRLARDDAKYVRDWVSGSPARRERRAVERMLERFEDWTGDLSGPQRARIEQFVREHPRMPELRVQDRRRWQQEALAHVKEHKKAEELAPRLSRVFGDPDASRSREYAAASAKWESGLTDLLLDVEKTLTPEQRSRVLRRLARYADDFRALSQGRAAVAPAAAGPGG
jgi:hypothetical protein